MCNDVARDLIISIRIRDKRSASLNQAQILRACRAIANLSQKEVAEKLNVSPSTVCRWEVRGCKGLVECRKLSKLYGQSLELISGVSRI